jgi:DNA invertase Pin-like site-specific DNA recombinase
LEAQRTAVSAYVHDGILLAEFEEIESGAKTDRPALDAALRECRLRGAVLVIAKLDRLSRNVSFIAKLMDNGVDFLAVDMPAATRFTLHIMAAMAEQEREMISQRTKVALAAARNRGVVLGGRRGSHRIEDHAATGRLRSAEIRAVASSRLADDHLQIVAQIQTEGTVSIRGIARELNARSILAPRGGTWSAGQVSRLVRRAPSHAAA